MWRLVVVVLAFLHHERSDRSLAYTTGCGMVTRRRATKEGASTPLKWAVRHPPHDRVIIVFDADSRAPLKLKTAGGMS
jgi:hypothetical protein